MSEQSTRIKNSEAYKVALDSLCIGTEVELDAVSSDKKRIGLLIVLVDWVSRRRLDSDAVASVQDESGHIRAHMHEDVMEQYPDMRQGSILVLKRIAVLSIGKNERCLNVHPNNVVTVLPPETSKPATDPLKPLSEAWIQRWIELGARSDIDNWQSQVRAAALRNTNDLRTAIDSINQEKSNCNNLELCKEFDLCLSLCKNALALRKAKEDTSATTTLRTCVCGHSSRHCSDMCFHCGRLLPELPVCEAYQHTPMTDTYHPRLDSTAFDQPDCTAPRQPRQPLHRTEERPFSSYKTLRNQNQQELDVTAFEPHTSNEDDQAAITTANTSPLPPQAQRLLMLLLLWNHKVKSNKQLAANGSTIYP